jgi:hypothetical protein
VSKSTQLALLQSIRDKLSVRAEIFRVAESDKKYTTFTMLGRNIKEAIRARLYKKLGPELEKYSGAKGKSKSDKEVLSSEDINNIVKSLNSPIKTAINNTKKQMEAVASREDSLVKVFNARGGFTVIAEDKNDRSNYDLIKRNYDKFIVNLSQITADKISKYLTEKGIEFKEEDIQRDFSSGRIFALEHSEDGGVSETQALAAIEEAIDANAEKLLKELGDSNINNKADLTAEVINFLVESDEGVTIESIRDPQLGTQKIELFLGSFVSNSISGGKSGARRAKLEKTIERLLEENALIFANSEGSDSLLEASRKRIGKAGLKPLIEADKKHKTVKILEQEDYGIDGKRTPVVLKDKAKTGTQRAKTKEAKPKPVKIGVSNSKNPAENLLNLQALLNAKLPNVVRKNMGYPALINRTGTFASSVKVTDIIKTRKGFPSVGYTYDKNPYQVFEQGAGKTPWSSSDRDPRKLIDRSIREVAAELALGRFFTRRT